MKGIVFNLLEEAVTRRFGPEGWDELVTAAGVSGVYTSLGSYPDSDLAALVAEASRASRLPVHAVLQWFGREAMPMMAERYAEFFEGHTEPRSFVLSVNEIIHPEVRKLYSGAGCPNFAFRHEDDGSLLIGYASPRQLCRLAHGFIEGASDLYNSPVSVKHRACMHDGDQACLMAVSWT